MVETLYLHHSDDPRPSRSANHELSNMRMVVYEGNASMPESQHKYLYERLGDHNFQLLVNALLADRFSDFAPLPLRQAEGGRDGLRAVAPNQLLVYQVKWSGKGSEKDPVSWLDAVVRGEEKNIRRLAAAGVKKYVLVSNVPSTGKPGTGTFDRMNEKLDAHAKAFGLEDMTCIWREALDAMVDSAPPETKWAYADMLAGWDLVRYLINEDAGSRVDGGLRDLLRKVAATQWDEDERVKFSQVDIDRERVTDLFIDGSADRLRSPKATNLQSGGSLGPIATYLLNTDVPFSLVLGAPGQGKSTLSQYVCQAHRAAFVQESLRPLTLPRPKIPRFPLRFDLSDYARWLQGADVWDAASETSPKRKQRPASQATVECFIAELMKFASGGVHVSAKEVQDLFTRVPSLVVLDGLDEVGSITTRRKVVAAIDQFCSRSRAYSVPPKIVVTTRPSAGELPEPSTSLFEVLVLNPLDSEQRDQYLRKWCAVRGILGSEGQDLRASFKEKSAEPYIGELAGNPMQLTILLDLLHQQGAAAPTQRTELYDSYVNLLLAREANKHPKTVRKHRTELLEIIPFLGWYLHSRSEQSRANSRMTTADLQAAMRHFQYTYGKPESVVDELFEAATDRLWALTSKTEGIYEFEVLSLREYFAARFLYNYAGEDTRGFDRNTVFRELLRRPYWLNTARFYGGNAQGGDLYVLADGIQDEVAESGSRPALVAAWTLLTDGVFLSRPRQAMNVLDALCNDTGIPALLDALDRKEILRLPELPSLPSTANPTWDRITNRISADPTHPVNPSQVRTLRELLNQRSQFARWWATEMCSAIGSPNEKAWLAVAASCEGASGLVLDLDGMDLTADKASLTLNTGLVPPSGGKFEDDLIQAVLDGHCPDVTCVRSMPGQIAVALTPEAFYTSSGRGFADTESLLKQRRGEAINLLRKSGSAYAEIAAKRAFKAGEKDSTFPWSNTASALFDHVGRCWLASEIAIIGAASPFQSGYTRRREATPFGSTAHPSELLAESRANANDNHWWRQQSLLADDDLGKAEWTLALWCVASGPVISSLLGDWEAVLNDMSAARRNVVLRAAHRVSKEGWLEKRPVARESTSESTSKLLQARTKRIRSQPDEHAYPTSKTHQSTPPSLLEVSRGGEWLKVDTVAVYR